MANITSNTILKTFFTNLLMQVGALFTGIITARLLLPQGRGEYAAVMFWPNHLSGLGILGTEWSLSLAASSRPDEEADLARTALTLGLILASLTMSLSYFLVPYLLPSDKQHLAWLSRLFLLWVPLQMWVKYLLNLDQGRLRWRLFNFARLCFVIPYVAILLGFWVFRIDQVSWFVMAFVVSTLVQCLYQVFMHRNLLARGQFRWQLLTTLLRHGFPFFIATIGLIIAYNADKALVITLLPTELVGYYAAAFAFASIHSSLGSALGVTSFAALANEPEVANQARYLAQVFRQATVLYLMAAIGVALCAPLLIVPLFGPKFAPAVQPAVILAAATSLNALSTILNEGLRGRGKAYPGIAAQLLGGATMALGAWFWAGPYALLGIAAAAVLGSFVQLAGMVVAVTILLHCSPTQLWGLRLGEVKALYTRLHATLPFHRGLLGGEK